MAGVASERNDQRYGDIVVVGGGCYGSYYVAQLLKGSHAGAMQFDRIVVVDRDPACRVVAEAPDPTRVHVVVQEWASFFDEYLARQNAESRDAIVPSPLMPHLMYEWLLARARQRWPGRTIETRPLPADLATPWTRPTDDGTYYASYATWMCPINCVEPRRCPHTREARDWTMPEAASELVWRGVGVEGPVIFHCTHRAYGVGMFDVRDVLAGDAIVRAAGEQGSANVLVGTVSHCHGAFNVLHLGVHVGASH